MREIEKMAWIETVIPMPGPASKRLTERLIRRAVKHEVIDGLGINEIPEEQVPESIQPVNVELPQEPILNNNNLNIIHERDALLNKVASFNEKYNV